MKHNFYEHPVDSLLSLEEYSEWDHVIYLIREHLNNIEKLDKKYPIDIDDLPFFPYFENEMKKKLIKAGFQKKDLDDPNKLKSKVRELDKQGLVYSDPVWTNRPHGFPDGSFTVRDDMRTMCVKPDVDGALRALELITIMKELLATNIEGIKIYLRSFELTINLARAGTIPSLAKAEVEKEERSKKTRELKKEIIRKAINNIFQANPTMDKTLGHVWNKFDVVNKNIKFLDRETGEKCSFPRAYARGKLRY